MTGSGSHGVAKDLDGHVAKNLKSLLVGVSVGSEFVVDATSDLCSSLEQLLPVLFSKAYAGWRGESLDGILVARARKLGEASAELVGACILISDQTVTPLCVELTVDAAGDRIESYRVRLGEAGGGRLGISGPAYGTGKASTLPWVVVERLPSIDWAYEVVGSGS